MFNCLYLCPNLLREMLSFSVVLSHFGLCLTQKDYIKRTFRFSKSAIRPSKLTTNLLRRRVWNAKWQPWHDKLAAAMARRKKRQFFLFPVRDLSGIFSYSFSSEATFLKSCYMCALISFWPSWKRLFVPAVKHLVQKGSFLGVLIPASWKVFYVVRQLSLKTISFDFHIFMAARQLLASITFVLCRSLKYFSLFRLLHIFTTWPNLKKNGDFRSGWRVSK